LAHDCYRFSFRYLVQLDLLKGERDCDKCSQSSSSQRAMSLVKTSEKADGYMWRCCECRKKQSIRDGSVFYRASGPIQVYFALLYMWIHDYDNRFVEWELKLDDKTVTSWFAYFRDTLSSEPTGKIGGEEKLVEFDQTCLTHQKHHRGKKKPGTQVCRGFYSVI
jgi:hypothetical protein